MTKPSSSSRLLDFCFSLKDFSRAKKMFCFGRINSNERASRKSFLEVIMQEIRTANRHRWVGVRVPR